MVIRECGLLFRGYTLIYESYHQTSKQKIDKDLRSGLLTALINFAESAFSKNLVEYFEMKKFVIVFIEDKIFSYDSPEPEVLMIYAILDKEKKIDKHISKVIIPSLKEIIKHFKEKYEGKNLSEISQFKDFKKIIKEILGSDIETLDQKLKGTFF
jgi:hypothetical protein